MMVYPTPNRTRIGDIHASVVKHAFRLMTWNSGQFPTFYGDMSVRRRTVLVVPRGSARGAPKHGAEGADALVAEVERDLRHRLAAAQPSHRFEHACLLAPGAEAEAGLALEMAREGAGAGVDRLGPGIERPLVAGRLEQRLAELVQSRIARHRQLQRQRLQPAQLRQDQRDDVTGRTALVVLHR